jgi:hypothetical protein
MDALTNGNYNSQQLEANNPNRWEYYGSAVAQNAPISYSMDTTKGLYLGVRGVAAGQWAGFFAMTPALDAQLYHAVLTIPYSSIKDNSFNTGLYVQTANGLINYVTCVAGVTPSGIVWAIVRTTGNTQQATQFETLWTDSTSKLQTRDCTIITNGDNFLQVYMDNKLVYSSSSLKLQMPAPFNAFLEVQTSTATEMLTATYKDYYATKGSKISITDAPAGATIKILKGSTLLASGTANSVGVSEIDLGKYHFPLTASIQVIGSDGKIVASTSSEISIWGGDIYSTSAQTTSLQSSALRASTLMMESSDSESTSYEEKAGIHVLPDSIFEVKKSK